MVDALRIWITALDQGYIRDPLWVAWAERQLLQSTDAAVWLVELYEAEKPKEALSALWHGWRELGRQSRAPDTEGSFSWADVRLAILYFRFVRGDFTIEQFLREVFDVAEERSGTLPPPCLTIVQRLFGCGEHPWRDPATALTAERIRGLFLPLASLVKDQLGRMGIGAA
jgi:hypothetical protein